jgi:hypothetical protein
VTTFFIPGIADDPLLLEDAYVEMRRQVELDLGRPPTPRRILRLWSRQGRVDCITEVGRADPLRGSTVMAIFDMGPRQPFVVWRQGVEGRKDGVREVLGSHAYAVSEFDR